MRKKLMHITQPKSFRTITLLFVVCSPAAIAQVRSKAPSSAQRQPPPVVQQSTPSGGMLQPRQPSSVLRPALLGNDIENMTEAQFRALPAAAEVRYKGQNLTKSSYIEQRLRE